MFQILADICKLLLTIQYFATIMKMHETLKGNTSSNKNPTTFLQTFIHFCGKSAEYTRNTINSAYNSHFYYLHSQ